MSKIRTAAAALLAFAVVHAAPSAMARTASDGSRDRMRIVVNYGDLNLASREGAEALRARVVHAAMLIKGDIDPRDLQGMAELRKAREAALGMADAIIVHSQPAIAAVGGAPNHLEL